MVEVTNSTVSARIGSDDTDCADSRTRIIPAVNLKRSHDFDDHNTLTDWSGQSQHSNHADRASKVNSQSDLITPTRMSVHRTPKHAHTAQAFQRLRSGYVLPKRKVFRPCLIKLHPRQALPCLRRLWAVDRGPVEQPI